MSNEYKTGTDDKLAVLEAILFSSAQPLEAKSLMNALGTKSEPDLHQLISELEKTYDSPRHALRIVVLPGERYVMQLKPEFTAIVRRYVKRPLFSKAVMRTLSFIAYHQPVYQSRVAAARGSGSYQHIKILAEAGFVEAEQVGRTKLLKTTTMFADYLGVENDPKVIKKQIRRALREPDAGGQKT
ncbi:MAG: SMC-Scp complex subunit ScpB [Aigarchaeota archaeon]|nr:SMC-Scp complex subunit ScpB [Aigarchaeota archaeon]